MRRCPRKFYGEESIRFLIDAVSKSWIFNNNLASLIVSSSGDQRSYSTQDLVSSDSYWSASDSERCCDSVDVDWKPLHGQCNRIAPGENHTVLQASCLQHWFKNWQEKRKFKLTASTFGLAIGFWPNRRAQLWLEKIGAQEPFMGGLASCWNNIKEEEALERYKLITGHTLLFPEFQVYRGIIYEENNWLAASPDGVVVQGAYDLPSRGMLEVKCPFFNGEMEKACPWKRIPLYYIPQAQGLMEILDKDWIELYCWTPHGSSLFRIHRDPDYWNVLKLALSDFWWKHVVPAREIFETYEITEPLTQLRSFRPSPRHELLHYIVIRSKLIVDDSPLLLREINGKPQN